MGKTPEEAGAIEWPSVVELLEYWAEFPPSHLLLRALAGYDGKRNSARGHRAQRAAEMGDFGYRPEVEEEREKLLQAPPQVFETGARHITAAPGHVQEAIERVKRGQHLDLPKPSGE